MSESQDRSQIATRHLVVTQRLRQRRDDLGLTQKQIVTRLARCGLRTTNRALSSLEHGSGLDVAKLPELATALDCTVTYLIGLTDDPHSWEPDHAVGSSRRGTMQSGAEASMVVSVPPEEPPTGSFILGEFFPERRPRGGLHS